MDNFLVFCFHKGKWKSLESSLKLVVSLNNAAFHLGAWLQHLSQRLKKWSHYKSASLSRHYLLPSYSKPWSCPAGRRLLWAPPRHTACCSKRTGTKGSSVTPICYLSCVGHVRPALGSAGAQIPAPSLSCSVTLDQFFNFPRFCFLIRKMGIIKIIRVFTLGLLRGLNEMMHVKWLAR